MESDATAGIGDSATDRRRSDGVVKMGFAHEEVRSPVASLFTLPEGQKSLS